MAVMILTLLLSAVYSTHAVIEFHRIYVKVHGVDIPEDVLYDKNNAVAILNVNELTVGNVKICQSSNFHDLDKKILAIKDINSGTCYLVVTQESSRDIENLFDKRKTHEAPLLPYLARRMSVPAKHVEVQAGKKIADFCKDYETRWLIPDTRPAYLNTGTSRRRRDLRAPCSFACGVCAFAVKSEPGAV